MTVEERLQPALQLRPEVASLNMGTMNFGLYEMLPRQKEWKWEWEPTYLAGSEAGFFKNTLKDIADILWLCSGNGTRFELECYGHLIDGFWSPATASATRLLPSSRVHFADVRP